MSLFTIFKGLSTSYNITRGNAVFVATLSQIEHAIEGDKDGNGKNDWQPVSYFLAKADAMTHRHIKSVIGYVTEGTVQLRTDDKAKWKHKAYYKTAEGKKADEAHICKARFSEMRTLAFDNSRPRSIFSKDVTAKINAKKAPTVYKLETRAKAFVSTAKENGIELETLLSKVRLAFNA